YRALRAGPHSSLLKPSGTGVWWPTNWCCWPTSLDHPRVATGVMSANIVVMLTGMILYPKAIAVSVNSFGYDFHMAAGYGLYVFVFILTIPAMVISAVANCKLYAAQNRAAGQTPRTIVVMNPAVAYSPQRN